MYTKNIEREFNIEVIASLLENRLLNYNGCKYIVTENDLYDICSFITGEDINALNFYKNGEKIKNILLQLHPQLNMRINFSKNNILYDVDTKAIIYKYKENFGDTYKVKSLKKCIIKSLRIQDK